MGGLGTHAEGAGGLLLKQDLQEPVKGQVQLCLCAGPGPAAVSLCVYCAWWSNLHMTSKCVLTCAPSHLHLHLHACLPAVLMPCRAVECLMRLLITLSEAEAAYSTAMSAAAKTASAGPLTAPSDSSNLLAALEGMVALPAAAAAGHRQLYLELQVWVVLRHACGACVCCGALAAAARDGCARTAQCELQLQGAVRPSVAGETPGTGLCSQDDVPICSTSMYCYRAGAFVRA